MNALISFNNDYTFLSQEKKSNFENVNIDDTIQLLGRKKGYKGNPKYQEFKTLAKELKLAKLPFRIVEYVDDILRGKDSFNFTLPDDCFFSLPTYIENPKIQKARKKAFKSFILFRLLRDTEKELTILEKIHFLHGTNSSILPMIRSTHTLVPSGRLLDQGIAPMCGELNRGGLKESNSVNQSQLSAESIRNLNRVLSYSSEISNSFDPEAYKDPEAFFNEKLEELKKSNPLGEDWDTLINSLNRLKQWSPDVFQKLLEKNKDTIIDIKNTAVKNQLSPVLQNIYEIINYTEDEIQKIKKEGTVPFSILNREGYFYDPNQPRKILPVQSISSLSKGKNILMHHWSNHSLKILTLLVDTYEAIEKEKKQHNEKHLRELAKNYLGNENEPWTEENVHLLREKAVREPLRRLIQSKIVFVERRLKRLESIFTPPIVILNHKDRELITNPFGIVFASTKMKADIWFKSELTFSQAKLGEDIDLMFVPSKHTDTVNQWIKDQDLSGKIKVLDIEILQKEQVNDFPLFHSPRQVIGARSVIGKDKVKELDANLNRFVFPLYRQPYPNNHPRKHHGVPHAARAALFAQTLMEMAYHKGVEIKRDPVSLILAMALHDVARLNDGKDLWDRESGEKTTEVLMNHLNVSKEDAQFFGQCIAEKDAEVPTSLEQKLIHDGDCIEIIRALVRKEDFDFHRLRVCDLVGFDELAGVVEEAKAFISLTEEEVVKRFLENTNNPYAALVQMINYAYGNFGKFDLLFRCLRTTIEELSGEESFCLPEEVIKFMQNSKELQS